MKKLTISAACFVAFMLTVLNSFSQDCGSSALFKKGAILEYHTYLPKPAGLLSSKIKFFESTILSFTVDNVVDSAGSTYSYITKKGTAAKRDKNSYEKKYTLTCREGKIYMPVDFYQTDTVYISDVYPNVKKDAFYSSMVLKQPAMQYFSVDPAKKEFAYADKRYTNTVVVQDYGWQRVVKSGDPLTTRGYEQSASLQKNEMEVVITVQKAEVKGKQKVDAADRSYDCYRVDLKLENKIEAHKGPKGPMPNMAGTSMILVGNIYYNESIGIVKTSTAEDNGAYFELYKVTLP